MRLLALFSLVLAASGQRTFETPESAAQAVIDAAASNNTPTLNAIFGSNVKTMLTNGSAEADRAARDEFASIARNNHGLRRDENNPQRILMTVGSQEWPFPIPIVGQGAEWRFDASSIEQSKEINELYAIEACASYVGAQREFSKQTGAQHFAQKLDELGDLIPSGMNQQPYHGYNFRVLYSQGPNGVAGERNYVIQGTMLGGFALIAWPAEYGSSGVRTFIVSGDGAVYQKDLGPSPPQISRYDPDPSWKPVY